MDKMHTITKYVYTFDELSDDAKENARNWWRECESMDTDFHECVFDDYKEGCGVLGIDIDQIYYSGFYSQGDGACFTGTYSYKKGWKALLKAQFGGDLIKPFLEAGNELQAIQSKYFYKLSANLEHTGRYYHENSVSINVTAEDDIYLNLMEAEEDITDTLRSLMQDLYSSLERAYAWVMSDENIDDNIKLSEYEFDEDGYRV